MIHEYAYISCPTIMSLIHSSYCHGSLRPISKLILPNQASAGIWHRSPENTERSDKKTAM